MTAKPVFDLEAAFTNEIEPLLDRLLEACDAHGVPMFAVIGYRGRKGEGDYCVAEVAIKGRDSATFQALREAVDAYPCGEPNDD